MRRMAARGWKASVRQRSNRRNRADQGEIVSEVLGLSEQPAECGRDTYRV